MAKKITEDSVVKGAVVVSASSSSQLVAISTEDNGVEDDTTAPIQPMVVIPSRGKLSKCLLSAQHENKRTQCPGNI